MTLKFSLIGSGAVRPNPGRAGPAQVVRFDDELLLFDCGPSSVRALAAAGFAPQDVAALFITHLHFDHVADFPYLVLVGWNNGRSRALDVVGPPGTAEFAADSVTRAFKIDIDTRLGHGKDPAGMRTRVREIREPGQAAVGRGWTVAATGHEHAGMANLAYLFEGGGGKVAIIGDAAPSEDLVAFCAGADLLACECSGTRDFLDRFPWGAWHMTPREVAALARRAGVGRVVLKHFVMEDIDGDREAAERMAREVRSDFDGEVIAGYDGLAIDVAASSRA